MTDCSCFTPEVLLVVSGVTPVEDRRVDLDVFSPLLVAPSSSLEICRTWVYQALSNQLRPRADLAGQEV